MMGYPRRLTFHLSFRLCGAEDMRAGGKVDATRLDEHSRRGASHQQGLEQAVGRTSKSIRCNVQFRPNILSLEGASNMNLLDIV